MLDEEYIAPAEERDGRTAAAALDLSPARPLTEFEKAVCEILETVIREVDLRGHPVTTEFAEIVDRIQRLKAVAAAEDK